MSQRIVVFAMVLIAVLCGLAAANSPVVLQPDGDSFSASELRLITSNILQLEVMLGDETLGSQRSVGTLGWASSEFAMYTAGSLADRGYSCLLASGGEWPDGVHTWVLVGVPVGNRIVWIPVEATPATGTQQLALGAIPFASRGAEGIRFDGRYQVFASVAELPENLRPEAMVRSSSTTPNVNEGIRLLALGSHDPDGEIILYRWCVDSAPCFATSSWSTSAVLRTAGRIGIALYVIDNAGASATATVFARVSDPEADAEAPTGGCGCG